MENENLTSIYTNGVHSMQYFVDAVHGLGSNNCGVFDGKLLKCDGNGDVFCGATGAILEKYLCDLRGFKVSKREALTILTRMIEFLREKHGESLQLSITESLEDAIEIVSGSIECLVRKRNDEICRDGYIPLVLEYDLSLCGICTVVAICLTMLAAPFIVCKPILRLKGIIPRTTFPSLFSKFSELYSLTKN
ncbi:hypothetical protein ACOME3_006714 [Neoechinorhynchus agilis]